MIIRLTAKLAKKIKDNPTTTLPRAPNPFADWAANLFTAERTQYIILTNSASLYSVIFYGRGITEFDIFIDLALAALSDHMHDAGHGEIFDKHIAPLAGKIAFSRTGDRSLLGSMNDHIRCAKAYLEHEDESPFTVSCRLNKTPMGALDYRYPKDTLEQLAEVSGLETCKNGKVIPFPRKT